MSAFSLVDGDAREAGFCDAVSEKTREQLACFDGICRKLDCVWTRASWGADFNLRSKTHVDDRLKHCCAG